MKIYDKMIILSELPLPIYHGYVYRVESETTRASRSTSKITKNELTKVIWCAVNHAGQRDCVESSARPQRKNVIKQKDKSTKYIANVHAAASE